jgi:hypothetical protein
LIKTKKISKYRLPPGRTPNGGFEQREEAPSKKTRFVKGADDVLAGEIASNRSNLPSEFNDGKLTYYIDVAGDSLSPETLQTVSARVSREPINPRQEKFIEQFFDSIDYLTGMEFQRVQNPDKAERVIGQVFLTKENGEFLDSLSDLTRLSGNASRNGKGGAKDVWIYESGQGNFLFDSDKYKYMNAVLVSFGFKDLGVSYPATQTVMGSDRDPNNQFDRGFAYTRPEAGYLKPTDYRALLYSFGEP